MNIHKVSMFGYLAAAIAATVDQLAHTGGLAAILAVLGPVAPAFVVAIPILTHSLANAFPPPPVANPNAPVSRGSALSTIFAASVVLWGMTLTACSLVAPPVSGSLSPAQVNACQAQALANAITAGLDADGKAASEAADISRVTSASSGILCNGGAPVTVAATAAK